MQCTTIVVSILCFILGLRALPFGIALCVVLRQVAFKSAILRRVPNNEYGTSDYNTKLLNSFYKDAMKNPFFRHLRRRITEQLFRAKSGDESAIGFIISLCDEIPGIYKKIIGKFGPRSKRVVDDFYAYLLERSHAGTDTMFDVFSPLRRDGKHFESIIDCLKCIAKEAYELQREGVDHIWKLIEDFRSKPGEVRDECVDFINDFKQELWVSYLDLRKGLLPEDVYRTSNFMGAAKIWALLMCGVPYGSIMKGSIGGSARGPAEGRPMYKDLPLDEIGRSYRGPCMCYAYDPVLDEPTGAV